MRKVGPLAKILYGVFFLMLVVGMAALSGCGKQNGSQSEVEIAPEVLEKAVDICGGEKGYYVAALDQILFVDENGKPGEVFSFPGRQIVQVAFGDTLYALDYQGQSVLKLDEDGEIAEEYALENPKNVFSDTFVDFEAAGSNVYLSVIRRATEATEEGVYVLPWQEKKLTKIFSEAVPLASFGEEGVCVYQNGEIVAYETSDRREADGGMYTSIATGEVLGSFCVDENNAYYYCTDQKVIREAEGQRECLHRMDTDYDVIASSGDTLLLLKRFERLTLVTKVAEKIEYDETLQLYGVGTAFDLSDGTHRDLKEEFETEFGVGVEREPDIGMNQETFLTNLMSGSDQYDLYRFTGMNPDSFYFVKNHAYVDLSSDEEIVDKLQQWYTPLVEGCTYQGEIFAVPSGVTVNLLYYNYRDYPGLRQEDLSTWDSFLDVLERYGGKVQFNRIRLQSVLLEQYVATCCDTLNGEYDFDTPTFRKALQLLRRISQMEIRYNENTEYQELFAEDYLFQFDNMMPYVEAGWEFLPMPSINGEVSVSPVQMGYNVINPNSEKQELAMEYMSLLAEMGQYARKDTAQQYPLLADIFENRAKCIYGNYAEYGDALDAYCNGEMTEDEAVEAIEEQTRRRMQQ